MSAHGAPTPREDHAAAWTGHEMIVWGGAVREPIAARPAPGPDRRASATDGVSEREGDDVAEAVGADDEAATDEAGGKVGGAGERRRTERRSPLAASAGEARQLGTGARYDPVRDEWTAMTQVGAPSPREDGVTAWSGQAFVVWGGREGDAAKGDGAFYLPERDRWCQLPAAGAPSPRRDHAGVWTDAGLMIWGGRGADGFLADGAVLRLDPPGGAVASARLRRSVEARGADGPSRRR